MPLDRRPASSSESSNTLRTGQYRDSGNLNARLELHRRFSVNRQGWASWLFDRLLEEVGTGSVRVLEAGCGAATLWRENRDRIPAGWSLVLTDFSTGMAEESSAALGERARCAVADVRDLPFGAACFDVVIANHMLYHVADRPRALREFARVLVAGGRFVASTVGDRHLEEIDRYLIAVGIQDLQGHAVSAPFTLENGGSQISTVFSNVNSRRYEDSLRVTAVEPLVDYVLSMASPSVLAEAALDRLRETLSNDLRARGVVSIHKDTGVFFSRR